MSYIVQRSTMATEIVEYSTLHSVHTDTHQNIMPYVLQATLQSLSPAFYRDKHQEKGVTVTSSNIPRVKKGDMRKNVV